MMDSVKEFFETLGSDFSTFVDKYLFKLLICVFIMLIFLGIKFAISAIIKRIVKKRSENNKTEGGFAETVITPPVRVLIITAGLFLCKLVLNLKGDAADFADKILLSLILASAFYALYGLCGYITAKAGVKLDKNAGSHFRLISKYMSAVLKVIVVIIGALTIIKEWGVDISSMLAGLSIGGVALALAAQDTAANLFGALTVIIDRPFEIGDFVEVNGIVGTVESMSLRSTIIRQLNQSLAFVPNSKLASGNIINWRMLSARRVETNLSVQYSTSTEKLTAFIESIKHLLSVTEKVKEGSYLVNFTEFGESSLSISVIYMLDVTTFAEMTQKREEINIGILRSAEECGVSFAFPTRSVYIEQNGDINEK